jgi:hypothetical protein
MQASGPLDDLGVTIGIIAVAGSARERGRSGPRSFYKRAAGTRGVFVGGIELVSEPIVKSCGGRAG